MDSYFEFLKVNHINSVGPIGVKLPSDVLEIIFEKYILSLNENDNTYYIDTFEKPSLYIIKLLKRHGYKCSSKTVINAVKNNNITVLNYLLENNINIGYAMKYAFINGNLEIIKLLINHKMHIIDEFVREALENNHFHILDYLIENKYKFNYINLLFSNNLNYKQLSWILNNYIDIKYKSDSVKYDLISYILNNNSPISDILLCLEFLKNNNVCIYSDDIIKYSLKNIELVKFFDKYVDELKYYNQYKNINIIHEILLTNNIEIIKYYVDSNKQTSIFKIFDNNTHNTYDLSYFNLDEKIIRYIYTNKKCNIELYKYYLIGTISDTNNISLLEWLYNNNHITLNLSMVKFTKDYDINKFFIDNVSYSDGTEKELLINLACRSIEMNSIYILELCHNKIMTFEDLYIYRWENIHYDYLDYAYKYNFYDIIKFFRNKNIWTKNNICYLNSL